MPLNIFIQRAKLIKLIYDNLFVFRDSTQLFTKPTSYTNEF